MKAEPGWPTRAVAALANGPSLTYQTIPLDRLLGDEYEAGRAVVLGHQCFGVLLAAVQPVGDVLKASIVFPLSVADDLDVNYPDLDDLQGALSEFEPPSLYLFHRTFAQVMSDFEEYRLPLAQTVHHVPGGVVTAHYSCYRDRHAREKQWAFSRAVWFEHFTPQLASPC